MSRIFSGKGNIQSIAPVASDNRWILAITKVPHMDIPVAGFLRKKLACYGRYQTE